MGIARKGKREGKKRAVCLVKLAMTLCVLTSVWRPALPVQSEEIGEYDLYAKAAVLMDGDSGRVLFGKNANLILPMASTTKIMTCIIALEQGDITEEVTVSSYAAAQPKVHLGMRKGEKYSLKDLLYSLMLESHNDTAVAIAEHIGGKGLDLPEVSERSKEESRAAVSAFADLMNKKALELGCTDTFFITPNGLDANVELQANGEVLVKQHSTTAEDLAKIMSYCAWHSKQKEQFLEITRQSSYTFSEKTTGRGFGCTNHNAFLGMRDGALTGKTGFTNAAGYCYVGALEKDGERYVVALLACGWPSNKSWKWSDTSKLMDYGVTNYEIHDREEYEYVKEKLPEIPVENGQTELIGGKVSIRPEIVKKTEPANGVLLKQGETIEVICKMKKSLAAPIRVGDVIGTISYMLGEEILWEERIVVTKNVLAIDYKWCFEQVLKKYLLK